MNKLVEEFLESTCETCVTKKKVIDSFQESNYESVYNSDSRVVDECVKGDNINNADIRKNNEEISMNDDGTIIVLD